MPSAPEGPEMGRAFVTLRLHVPDGDYILERNENEVELRKHEAMKLKSKILHNISTLEEQCGIRPQKIIRASSSTVQEQNVINFSVENGAVIVQMDVLWCVASTLLTEAQTNLDALYE